MHLKDYLKKEKMTYRTFGALLKNPKSPQFIGDLVSGRRKAGLEVLAEIVAATGGMVSPETLRPDIANLFLMQNRVKNNGEK